MTATADADGGAVPVALGVALPVIVLDTDVELSGLRDNVALIVELLDAVVDTEAALLSELDTVAVNDGDAVTVNDGDAVTVTVDDAVSVGVGVIVNVADGVIVSVRDAVADNALEALLDGELVNVVETLPVPDTVSV